MNRLRDLQQQRYAAGYDRVVDLKVKGSLGALLLIASPLLGTWRFLDLSLIGYINDVITSPCCFFKEACFFGGVMVYFDY